MSEHEKQDSDAATQTPEFASDKARKDSKTQAFSACGKNGVSFIEATQGQKEIVVFPLRAPVELTFVSDLKSLTYKYVGRLTVAQVIGCFDIALTEIKEEQDD